MSFEFYVQMNTPERRHTLVPFYFFTGSEQLPAQLTSVPGFELKCSATDVKLLLYMPVFEVAYIAF